jgi:hypothetical protein
MRVEEDYFGQKYVVTEKGDVVETPQGAGVVKEVHHDYKSGQVNTTVRVDENGKTTDYSDRQVRWSRPL